MNCNRCKLLKEKPYVVTGKQKEKRLRLCVYFLAISLVPVPPLGMLKKHHRALGKSQMFI